MLANEASPSHRDGGRVSHGYAVDVALLALTVLLIMELHKLLRRRLSVCRGP